jgi:trehalose 6-phosphate phosphatase
MLSLFIDLDGTMIDLAGSPDAVHVPQHLPESLDALYRKLGGALAIASGRYIATLDRLLAPYVGPALGVHGIEYREPRGNVGQSVVRPAGAELRVAVDELVHAFPPAFVEDKGSAIAVHFHGEAVRLAQLAAALQATCDGIQPDWRCLSGHRVIELKPCGIDKGVGLARLMLLPPFAGTRPVAMGDDITDLDLFSAARERGGLTITVGDRIAGNGDCHLPTPAAALRFLELWISAEAVDDIGGVATLVTRAAQVS